MQVKSRRQESAGVLLYRWRETKLEVLLVHPGGPFWRRRDSGAWQLPKGLIAPGEPPEAAARREAQEELGRRLNGPLMPLGVIKQAGGKRVHGFALGQDYDADRIDSNLFELEWPPHSGRVRQFPEIDRAKWMALEDACKAILPSQRILLDRLQELLPGRSSG